MKEKEINFKTTQVLISGRKMLDCYKQHGCPTSGDKYKLFVYDALKIALEYPIHYQIDWFLDFLINNEGNDLPMHSSGSLYSALIDPDNFGEAVGCEEYDFTAENYKYFDTLYNSLFRG